MYVDIVISHIFNLNKHFFFFFLSFSPYDNPPEQGRVVRKEQRGQAKMATWNSFSYIIMYQLGLSTLSDLSRLDLQPPPSFLYCARPHSHHPSSLTSVSLLPALQLLPPSAPFWPYGTPPFSTCPNHLNTPWSALLANSLSIPALRCTSSFLYIMNFVIDANLTWPNQVKQSSKLDAVSDKSKFVIQPNTSNNVCLKVNYHVYECATMH